MSIRQILDVMCDTPQKTFPYGCVICFKWCEWQRDILPIFFRHTNFKKMIRTPPNSNVWRKVKRLLFFFFLFTKRLERWVHSGSREAEVIIIVRSLEQSCPWTKWGGVVCGKNIQMCETYSSTLAQYFKAKVFCGETKAIYSDWHQYCEKSRFYFCLILNWSFDLLCMASETV